MIVEVQSDGWGIDVNVKEFTEEAIAKVCRKVFNKKEPPKYFAPLIRFRRVFGAKRDDTTWRYLDSRKFVELLGYPVEIGTKSIMKYPK